MEHKEGRVSIGIEPTLLFLAADVAKDNDLSISAYIRQCIINDLKQRGKITQEVLEKVVN